MRHPILSFPGCDLSVHPFLLAFFLLQDARSAERTRAAACIYSVSMSIASRRRIYFYPSTLAPGFLLAIFFSRFADLLVPCFAHTHAHAIAARLSVMLWGPGGQAGQQATVWFYAQNEKSCSMYFCLSFAEIVCAYELSWWVDVIMLRLLRFISPCRALQVSACTVDPLIMCIRERARVCRPKADLMMLRRISTSSRKLQDGAE